MIIRDCIDVKNLCKVYHNKEVVKSIRFQVGQGQIFTFLGPNGAGKSTIMNIISTLLKKTEGEIIIDGVNMDTNAFAIKKKLGVVFQEDVLDRDLTIYKNLWYRGALYWKSDDSLNKQIAYIIKLLSLEKIQHQKYGECSGGQRRLVQIARALLPNPKLLILDEPTTGLDPVTRWEVWKVLLKLRNTLQMTIFYTTHYLEEASYADIICILKEGRIVDCGSLKEIQCRWKGILEKPTLNELYFHLLKGDEVCEISNIL
ncbi:MAG: ABC transporter ATP-binding protein [Lachnospiraceae bacterium]